MKTSLLLLTALMLSTSAAIAADTQSQLDGTKWKITAVPTKEGEVNFSKSLSFNDGQMTLESSESPSTNDFRPGKYTSKMEKNRQTFTAEVQSDKEGTAKYNGYVVGNNISGTVDCKRSSDGKNVKYNFNGSKEMN